MKGNELDRRVLKTRQAINEALFSLMEEKRYNKITIQDIIDRANVGRSTFYSHFATKDELLFSSVEDELEILNQYIKSYIEYDGEKPRVNSVMELFEHIQEDSKIVKGLFKTESADFFFEKVEIYWNHRLEEYLQSKLPLGKNPKVPIKILTNHISSTLINLLKWWVNNNMSYTPSQMDQYFRDLINPCIDSVFYNDSTKS
ncbi:TetR/AcrR family transcriptional regulator [Evansella tamaricis]|uniref:TetR/AcrR family transcriptional regulator n=1 Tax=Evansella tamaricis TaxID=2069301 RepID=A0ABS6JD65_9BACI|nr:TetR/AcrR family transcriptional regulator [Evansella tamaricis]MBU9711610.1 TetR/AcrR family transcriptional regulator [Evansella tamaricis]MBU9713239.1 TetR/AcrR family transcriptional regulator [Evansella tamaricis]